MSLADRNNNMIRVWAPSKLVTDIKEKRQHTERPYVSSLGQIRYKDKKINKFDLVFQETKKPIDLFHKE